MLFGNDKDDYLLYHYTSLETGIEKILSTGKLRMGPFTNTNDPRETKNWIFKLDFQKRTSDEIKSLHYDSNMRELTDFLRKPCRMLSFSIDPPQVADKINFYKGDYRPRMWAQYGENHRGMCIVFRKYDLLKNIEKSLADNGNIFVGKVNYDIRDDILDSRELTIKIDDLLNRKYEELSHKIFSEKYYEFYFFRKHIDWESEAEYRIIFRGHEINEFEFIPIEDSIEGITLGVDFPRVYLPVGKALCDHYNIEYSFVIWHNGVPSTDPEQIWRGFS